MMPLLTEPFQSAVGTKRTLSVLPSSSALPLLAVKSNAVQSPEATLYCQLPCVLSTAETAIALGTPLLRSGSVMRPLTISCATVLPALLLSSSLMALKVTTAEPSTGASFTAVRLI